jgi:hypothetical protein
MFSSKRRLSGFLLRWWEAIQAIYEGLLEAERTSRECTRPTQASGITLTKTS